MTVFVDPSVQFGRQVAADAPAAAPTGTGLEPPPAAEPPESAPAESTPTPPEPPKDAPKDEGSAEVVRLDRFRKK
jgi:hypothetical protein